MRRVNCKSSFQSAMVVSLVLPCLPAPANASEWQWLVVPYLWASGTSVDMTIDPYLEIEGTLNFSDLLDEVNYGFQVHLEGQRDKFGVFADITYLNASDGMTTPPGDVLPGGSNVHAEISTWLVELGGTYRLFGDAGLEGFDVLAGVRIIDMDLQVDIDLRDPLPFTDTVDASDTYYDGFIGVRYGTIIGSHWALSIRGDVGTGDTDITWNGLANVSYLFGSRRQFAAILAYRYMRMELSAKDSGQDIDTTLDMSGPALGFLFRF